MLSGRRKARAIDIALPVKIVIQGFLNQKTYLTNGGGKATTGCVADIATMLEEFL